MELTLRVHDPSGSVSRDVRVQLSDESTVLELVDALVELFGWPRETMDGEPLTYAARRVGQPEALASEGAVATVRLVHGDALVLGPLSCKV